MPDSRQKHYPRQSQSPESIVAVFLQGKAISTLIVGFCRSRRNQTALRELLSSRLKSKKPAKHWF